jgi:hypothetical protein
VHLKLFELKNPFRWISEAEFMYYGTGKLKLYEGESNENLKSAKKIIGNLPCAAVPNLFAIYKLRKNF